MAVSIPAPTYLPGSLTDSGLFKRNGLDVELIFASSSLMMPAVLNKDILLADANAFGLINVVLGGVDLVMIAARSVKMEGVLFVTRSD